MASATNFSGSLSGDVTGTQSATAIAAATVTGKLITGFVSGSGTVAATDTILQAVNKLDGNVALKAPLASPTFSGTVILPTVTGGSYSMVTNTGVAASSAVVTDSAQRITNSVTTATELSYVSGVTSALQTQLGTKAPLASPTFTGTLAAPTVNVTSSLNFPTSVAYPGNLSAAGRIYYNSSLGLVSYGAGTGFDLYWLNKNGSDVAYVPTGQSAVVFANRIAFTNNINWPSYATNTGVMYFSTINGLVTYGHGTTYDSTILNRNGSLVLANPTATTSLYAGGNVGIGITPVYPLHVVGAALASTVSQFTGTATNQNLMVGVVKTVTTTVANVGTAETNLMTSTFPASGLAATGDTVEILLFGTTAANANSKTVAAYFGATKVVQSAAFTTSAAAWRITGTITRTGAATQVACVTCFVDGATPVTTYTTPTETLSGTVTIKGTGTGAASSDITQIFLRNEFKPGNP